MEMAFEIPNIRDRKHSSRHRTALILICSVLLLLILRSTPAYAAAGDITTVIDSIRNWLAGILAALATLFLTVGGVRYLVANGNPRAMEEGKAAIKSALIGYALAALAPMFVDILRRVLAA
jgi:Type IV secretion system pilin